MNRLSSRPRSKKLLLVPLGVIVGVVLFLLFMAGWRIFHPAPKWIDHSDIGRLHALLDADTTPRGLYLFDERCGYRFKPGYRGVRHQSVGDVHETNSLGLLGSTEPSGFTRRVLLLGDSVTYGDGVAFESTFVARMQNRAQDGFYVGTAACPGWSTTQQFAYFGHYASDVHWDAIVLSVCLNDLVPFQWARFGDGKYDMVMSEATSLSVALELLGLRLRLRGDALSPLLTQDDATLLAWSPARWQSYTQNVLRPFVIAQDLPPMAVMVLPSLAQFESLKRGGLPDDVLFPQRQMEEFCRQYGLAYVDVVVGLEDVDAAACYLDNLHFSEMGHELVAKQLWPAIEQVAGTTGSTPAAKRD